MIKEDIDTLENYFFYRRLLSYSISHKPKYIVREIIKYPIWMFFRLIGSENILKAMESLALKFNPKNSEYVACVVSGYGINEIVPATVF